jgi:translation initiation factor 4A
MTLGEYLEAKVYACIGGTRIDDDIAALRAGVHVVVGTPGNVLDLFQRQVIDPTHLLSFVLDEADEMLSQGFKDQIHDIYQYVPQTCQVCLFSATMPNEALDITDNFMKNPLKILVKQEELTLDGIRQFYVNCQRDEWKFSTLCDLYSTLSIAQAVIFCNSRKTVDWLSSQLTAQEFPVSATHGEMPPRERKRILAEFKSGLSRILICTDLLARGIDVHGVSLVINYDLPRNFEKYIHRIGRSGRFGRKGVAVNLISEKEAGLLKEIEIHYGTKVEEMPKHIADYL